MADTLPIIWEGTAHTFAKHQILQTYLNAWFPIMSRQAANFGFNEEILFVDGFAGPGSYSGGQMGSPILALKSVMNHIHNFSVPVAFLFIEQHPERHEELKKAVSNLNPSMDHRIKSIDIKKGDCETLLIKFLNDRESKSQKVGPALFFLDQFGYSDISMQLINKIMQHKQCEIFSYLNWDRLNQFGSDQTKWPAITKAFGSEEWKAVFELETKHRPAYILNTYKKALVQKAGAKYVWHFAMADENDKLIYWLLFCTNNLRGLEVMKKAMYAVDSTGSFRFSDKNDPMQLNIFAKFSELDLANMLINQFAGKTVSVSDVEEWVLAETPAYSFKSSLQLLEREGSISALNPPPNRKKFSFADDKLLLRFLKYRCRQMDFLS